MGIIGWIILGGLAGWIASMFMGTGKSMGIMANIVVGIVGALIGGFIFNAIGGTDITGFNLWSLFVAVVGSVILLGIVKMISGNGKA
ncbi:MAG TPA: GlsB/YeaQ/YmgE family stress response membrane protein [Magnetospirillaceae bacterium]|nr:GlsB/YeaQ/YmgE family stress response membrane protein [Magnetospirillaceae bacterium]